MCVCVCETFIRKSKEDFVFNVMILFLQGTYVSSDCWSLFFLDECFLINRNDEDIRFAATEDGENNGQLLS